MKDGKPIACHGSTCEGDFDYTWTQHTAFRIDEKSDKHVIYVTAFDNGDARGMDQPALAEMKYSRAVVYRIDQDKKTIEQVWEYGKERGFPAVAGKEQNLPVGGLLLQKPKGGGAAFVIEIRQRII